MMLRQLAFCCCFETCLAGTQSWAMPPMHALLHLRAAPSFGAAYHNTMSGQNAGVAKPRFFSWPDIAFAFVP
jgi:hypothetical protein